MPSVPSSRGATGELLGELRGLQAEAHSWRGELPRAVERGNEALQLLPRYDDRWFWALSEVVQYGDTADALARTMAFTVADVCHVAPGRSATTAQIAAAVRLIFMLRSRGAADASSRNYHVQFVNDVARQATAPVDLIAQSLLRRRAVVLPRWCKETSLPLRALHSCRCRPS